MNTIYVYTYVRIFYSVCMCVLSVITVYMLVHSYNIPRVNDTLAQTDTHTNTTADAATAKATIKQSVEGIQQKVLSLHGCTRVCAQEFKMYINLVINMYTNKFVVWVSLYIYFISYCVINTVALVIFTSVKYANTKG